MEQSKEMEQLQQKEYIRPPVKGYTFRSDRDNHCERCGLYNPGGLSRNGFCNGAKIFKPGCTSKNSREPCDNYIDDSSRNLHYSTKWASKNSGEICDNNYIDVRCCNSRYLTKWSGTFGMYMCKECRQRNFDEYFIPKRQRNANNNYSKYSIPTVHMTKRGR